MVLAHYAAAMASPEVEPLNEYVIASRLRKNRAIHRALLLLRAALFILFLAYRVHTLVLPNRSCGAAARGETESSCRINGKLGVVALVCEVWFCVFFMLSIVMKWPLVERAAYPDRLLERIQELPKVDVFVTTADPSKEPPLITMNTVMSILTVDYPTNKLACYVSDDGGSLLTLWSLKETVTFAKSSWHPFCTKFSPYIQPRAPGPYFSRKENAEKAMKYGFSCEWHAIKEQYEALEAKIISMTAAYCKSKDETLAILLNELKGSSNFDRDQTTYSSWALKYDPRNHSSHCEILWEDPQQNLENNLPYLVYISREKRPRKEHHFKAGAMNSLLRVSGIMTNAPFILNLDCDMYVNESKSLLQAMCFFMESMGKEVNDKIGFVQFPQCFECLDEDDIYGTSMAAAMEIFLKGMDGAQGPIYCGTGCVHKRESLYGKSTSDSSQFFSSNGQKFNDMFGQCPNLIQSAQYILASTKNNILPMDRNALVRDSNALMDSYFEDKTSWGKEVGWSYGSVTEDLMTGMKIHGRGWRSVFYMPYRPAFLGCAPSTSEDALTTRKRWSMGMLEILFSSNSPLLPKSLRGLSLAQRLNYIYIYGWTLACPLFFTYSLLPTLSILGDKQIFPKVVEPAILMPMSLVMCMYLSSIYENQVAGIGMKQWWNSEKWEYIVAISSYIFGSYEVLKKNVLGLSESTFTITPKYQNVKSISHNDHGMEEDEKAQETSQETFVVNSTLPIFVPPTVVIIFNIVALIVALMRIARSPILLKSCWPSTELVCCIWILFMFQPFTKGFLLWVMGRSGPSVLSTSSIIQASFIVGALSLLSWYS